MSVSTKLIVTIGVIVLSTLAGYWARRRGWLSEQAARPIMTAVIVAGYPVVGFLAIWNIELHVADAWLPTLGWVQATILSLAALLIARIVYRDRQDRGLFALACTSGNHGVTMAGVVVFLLYGEVGLGLANLYALYTFFSLVFLMYPIAKHYSPDAQRRSLFGLLTSSLLDYRSIGVVACLAGIALSVGGVRRPVAITDYRIVDLWIYLLIVAAYVSVGLRLHLEGAWPLRRTILGVLGVRHLLGPVVGAGLLLLTRQTPWPLEGIPGNVFLVQSSVSVAVLCVGAANLFHIRPREASTIFVVSSLFYLAVVLPVVYWLLA